MKEVIEPKIFEPIPSLEEQAIDRKKQSLRKVRDKLLLAFDIYKCNLLYGIDTETEEEKADIMLWYDNVLELDEDAINNKPEAIKKYL